MHELKKNDQESCGSTGCIYFNIASLGAFALKITHHPKA